MLEQNDLEAVVHVRAERSNQELLRCLPIVQATAWNLKIHLVNSP